MERVFKIERMLPCGALRAYIDTYYLLVVSPAEGAPLVDRMLPELPNVRFQLDGTWTVDILSQGHIDVPKASLFGFTHAPFDVRVEGPGRVFGAGLKPLGWQALLGTSADALSDTVKPLDQVLADTVSADKIQAVHEALIAADDRSGEASMKKMSDSLDAFFLSLMKPVQERTARHFSAIEACLAGELEGDLPKVADMAKSVGLSVRQLERACRKLYGCGPKFLLRKHRFMSMLSKHGQDAAAQDWLEAADESFYDQSHYIREYKRFTGQSPSRYASRRNLLQREVADTYRNLKDRDPSGTALKVDGSRKRLECNA